MTRSKLGRTLALVVAWGAALAAVPGDAWAQLNDNDAAILWHAENVYQPVWAPEAHRQQIDSFWQRQDVPWKDWSCVGAARDFARAMVENDGLGMFDELPDGTTFRNIEGPSHTTTVATTPDGRYWMIDDYLGVFEFEEMVPVHALNPQSGQVEPAWQFKDLSQRLTDETNGQPLSTWGYFGGTWFVSDFADSVQVRKEDGQWVSVTLGREGAGTTGTRGIPEAHAASVRIDSGESVDPNVKEGPQGVGGTGRSADGATYDGGFLVGDGPLFYTIRFENLPTATAHTQIVRIDDALDASAFDLSSFELGPVTVLDRTATPYVASVESWTTHLDLRPDRPLVVRVETTVQAADATVQWTFTSLAPDSCAEYDCMEPVDPADPDAGALAPGEGGSVSFRVRLAGGLPDGVPLDNRADITFDPHVPGATVLPTNVWHNALDRAAPSSSVQPLDPAQAAPAFTVRWTGDDAGSGVQEWAVFVSTDGGAHWTRWIDRTTFTEATFHGEPGTSYAFYSLALDRAGNREAPPAVPDAMTTVATPSAGGLLGYAAKTTDRADALAKECTVTLDDPTFAERENYTLSAPTGLQLPASVDGEPPGDPAAHLLVYPLHPATLGIGSPAGPPGKERFPKAAKHVGRTVAVTNAFGGLALQTGQESAVFVPAAKDLAAPPAAVPPEPGWYKCYTVKVAKGASSEQAPGGKFRADLQAVVEDQFADGRLRRCAAGSPKGAGKACTTDEACGGTTGTTALCEWAPHPLLGAARLYDLKKPLRLCNAVAVGPIDTTETDAAGLTRTTTCPVAAAPAGEPATYLCYQVKASAAVVAADAASRLGVTPGTKLVPKQSKHVKRAPYVVDVLPHPRRVGTTKEVELCLPLISSTIASAAWR